MPCPAVSQPPDNVPTSGASLEKNAADAYTWETQTHQTARICTAARFHTLWSQQKDYEGGTIGKSGA